MLTENGIQSVAVVIGALSLALGVFDARRASRHAARQHFLQANISVYSSFREKWETQWEDILDLVETAGRDAFHATAEPHQVRTVRRMLNWVDWLGTMKSTGIMDDISFLTDGIGPALRRIIECGRPIIERDVAAHGTSYWKNLFLVAEHLNICWATQLNRPVRRNR